MASSCVGGQQAALAHELADAPAGLDGGLGDVGRFSVPDVRAEGGGDGGAAIEQLAAARFVGLDAGDAARVEDAHRVAEDARRVQRVPGDHRHHHVQLELAAVRGGQDRGIAADHLVADLVDHLGHRRVDLAGHDRRARLHRRQLDLGDAGARAHAQEPQVGRDLAHFDREPAQRARAGEHVAHALGDAEAVVGRTQRQAGRRAPGSRRRAPV